MTSRARSTVRSLALPGCVLSCTLAAAQTGPAAPAPAARPPAAAPAVLDRTGVSWTLPFAAARARAKTEHRLLFVPVIAGGTDATGCW